jgi:hypothetical protein
MLFLSLLLESLNKLISAGQLFLPIEIGLERAPFFPSFEHAKNLLIMGPNNTKNSLKSVIFSYLTMNNIVSILLLL